MQNLIKRIDLEMGTHEEEKVQASVSGGSTLRSAKTIGLGGGGGIMEASTVRISVPAAVAAAAEG